MSLAMLNDTHYPPEIYHLLFNGRRPSNILLVETPSDFVAFIRLPTSDELISNGRPDNIAPNQER